ncbi:DUF3467 domain-containing protein [Roseateles sp. NT4]|uniref:DUF3467 domain-containing protein n=1 Tax=Roseateles sp. NT4 TaxID=3453715 RepID=UPI003EEF63DE
MKSPTDVRRDWAAEGCPAAGASGGYQYANQFEVGFSRNEVLLRMAQAYEGEAITHGMPTRVVMTPSYAMALLQLLSEAMQRYEAEYGPVVPVGSGVVPQDSTY